MTSVPQVGLRVRSEGGDGCDDQPSVKCHGGGRRVELISKRTCPRWRGAGACGIGGGTSTNVGQSLGPAVRGSRSNPSAATTKPDAELALVHGGAGAKKGLCPHADHRVAPLAQRRAHGRRWKELGPRVVRLPRRSSLVPQPDGNSCTTSRSHRFVGTRCAPRKPRVPLYGACGHRGRSKGQAEIERLQGRPVVRPLSAGSVRREDPVLVTTISVSVCG